jgi:hypothetical protein
MHRRRALYVLVSVSVAAASVVSAADAATKTKPKHKPKPKPPVIPACASFTDPAGDSYLQADFVGQQPSDDTLDVTKVTYGVNNGALTISLAAPKYSDTQKASIGNEFDASFTVGGHEITLFANRGQAWTAMSAAFAQYGIRVDGTYKTGTNKLVTTTAKNGVITLTASIADLTANAGVPVAGATMSKFNFLSRGTYGAALETFDTGAAPDSQTAKVVNCK